VETENLIMMMQMNVSKTFRCERTNKLIKADKTFSSRDSGVFVHHHHHRRLSIGILIIKLENCLLNCKTKTGCVRFVITIDIDFESVIGAILANGFQETSFFQMN
jgi:hypothetical protein